MKRRHSFRNSFAPLGAVVVIAFGSWASAAAPIPAGPDVPTQAQFTEHVFKVLHRISVGPYREIGRHDPRWDEPAIAFIESYIWQMANRDLEQSAAHMLAGARAPLELGCDDPLVLYCSASVEMRAGDKARALELFRRAREDLLAAGYDMIWAARATGASVRLEREFGTPAEEVRRLEDLSLDQFAAAAASPNFGREDQRVLKWLLINETVGGYPRDRALRAWQRIEQAQNVDPWLKNVLGGRFYIVEGWRARGGGFAAQVTPEGWAGLEQNMTRAAELLVAAHQMRPDYPDAASMMIEVAMTGYSPPGMQMRDWFDRAVAAEFDYPEAYAQLRWGLRPRWGGSHEQMLQLGLECLDTGRFDTQVPYQLFHIVRGIANDHAGDFRIPLAMPGVYEAMIRMLDGYAAEPKNQGVPGWYESFRAAVAWRAGRYEDARRHLDEARPNIYPAPFARLDARVEEAAGEIVARSGAFAEKTAQASAAHQRQDFLRAAALFTEAAAAEGLTPAAVAYLRHQAWISAATGELNAGRWVHLPLDKDLTGWRVELGEWTVDERGDLTGKSSKDGLLLLCRVPLTGELEFTGELELVKGPNAKWFNGGLFCGYLGRGDHESVLVHPQGKLAVIRRNFRYGPAGVPAPVQRTNHLHVIVQRGKVTAYVNDQKVFDGAASVLRGPRQDVRIGVGGWYWYEGAILKFRNLKVRRLDVEAEPPLT